MDKLYIGDIPQEFHYAVFNNNYIELYNTSELQGTLPCYRIYMYDNFFAYDYRQTTYSQYYYTTAKDIQVTDDYMYRRDFPNILTCTLIFSIFFIFLFNVFTSVFKRGGIFSGIL